MSDNALISLEALKPQEIFVAGGTDSLIAVVEAVVKDFKADVTTEAGRKEIASLDRKIASSKRGVDAMKRTFTESVREQLNAINAEGKRFVDRMEELQAEVSAPLDEYKRLEKKRVEALTERLNQIKDYGVIPADVTSQELELRQGDIAHLNAGFDWQDFEKVAAEATEKSLEAISQYMEVVKQREAQEAELERLRQEAAERAKADEEERLRKEGEERAKREAQEKADMERRAQEEAIRAEQERTAKAEADRIAAEKAAQDARDNAERLAKEAAEKARLDEIARQEAEAARIKAEEEAREKDRSHRAKINNEAVAAIVAMGFEEKDAKELVKAIAQGKIPNIKVQY